jgi:hypothetical protein
MLKEIWSVNEDQKCYACYTDNVSTDSSCVLEAHIESFPNNLLSPVILLDIYHAKQRYIINININIITNNYFRVVKELQYSHPDFKAATADLSTIFAKLKHLQSYPSMEDFVNALNKWMEDYSQVHASLALGINERIQFFGNKFNIEIDIHLGMRLLNENTDNIQLPDAPSSIITAKVHNQIEILQRHPDLPALWNIRHYSDLGSQGTSSNEAVHSILQSSRPAKGIHM